MFCEEDTVIELKNVGKKLAEEWVLKNVTLDIEEGGIYGFVGQNGSGKTMLFRAILGLIQLTEGECYIDGHKVDFDHLPKDVGLLLEAPAFLPYLSGQQNLKLLSYLKSEITDKEISDMMNKVGLAKAKNKAYGKYSLGMKQRLGLASAFLHAPRLIILDEPTNALDSQGIEILVQLLKIYASKERIILIASHDERFLSQVTNRLFYMSKGQLTKTL